MRQRTHERGATLRAIRPDHSSRCMASSSSSKTASWHHGVAGGGLRWPRLRRRPCSRPSNSRPARSQALPVSRVVCSVRRRAPRRSHNIACVDSAPRSGSAIAPIAVRVASSSEIAMPLPRSSRPTSCWALAASQHPPVSTSTPRGQRSPILEPTHGFATRFVRNTSRDGRTSRPSQTGHGHAMDRSSRGPSAHPTPSRWLGKSLV